ncbi:MAG: hypothetical protein ABIQ88_11255 [Chitinophagaceae bacterium]
MYKLFLIVLFFVSLPGHAQELFSMTEPASNMAYRSIAVRVDNFIMDEINSAKINYHLIPGIRMGVSKKLMISSSAFFSNRFKQLKAEGAGVYAKYRFLSKDAVQKHFRMAAFGMLSFNNSDIHQEEINLYGHNTGFEAGIVATQLLHKVALSSTVSYLKAVDNGNNNKYIYGTQNSRAISYSFSAGKLILPVQYKDYHQTNVNLMVELLGQVNTGSGKYYTDVAPSVQLIFNSVSRVDIGYKKQVSGNLLRTAPNGFFIRMEINLFNAW